MTIKTKEYEVTYSGYKYGSNEKETLKTYWNHINLKTAKESANHFFGSENVLSIKEIESWL